MEKVKKKIEEQECIEEKERQEAEVEVVTEENAKGEETVEVSKEELDQLKNEVENKQKELDEYKDKMLRLAAEMENLRKRLEREKDEHRKYANEQLVKQLLPVIDNLERTLEHARQSDSIDVLVEGVEMTLNGFLSVLEQFGCQRIDATCKPFDPTYHEAIHKEESEEIPENHVISEYEKGFLMNERLLRPAKVIVSAGKSKKKEVDENGKDKEA